LLLQQVSAQHEQEGQAARKAAREAAGRLVSLTREREAAAAVAAAATARAEAAEASLASARAELGRQPERAGEAEAALEGERRRRAEPGAQGAAAGPRPMPTLGLLSASGLLGRAAAGAGVGAAGAGDGVSLDKVSVAELSRLRRVRIKARQGRAMEAEDAAERGSPLLASAARVSATPGRGEGGGSVEDGIARRLRLLAGPMGADGGGWGGAADRGGPPGAEAPPITSSRTPMGLGGPLLPSSFAMVGIAATAPMRGGAGSPSAQTATPAVVGILALPTTSAGGHGDRGRVTAIPIVAGFSALSSPYAVRGLATGPPLHGGWPHAPPAEARPEGGGTVAAATGDGPGRATAGAGVADGGSPLGPGRAAAPPGTAHDAGPSSPSSAAPAPDGSLPLLQFYPQLFEQFLANGSPHPADAAAHGGQGAGATGLIALGTLPGGAGGPGFPHGLPLAFPLQWSVGPGSRPWGARGAGAEDAEAGDDGSDDDDAGSGGGITTPGPRDAIAPYPAAGAGSVGSGAGAEPMAGMPVALDSSERRAALEAAQDASRQAAEAVAALFGGPAFRGGGGSVGRAMAHPAGLTLAIPTASGAFAFSSPFFGGVRQPGDASSLLGADAPPTDTDTAIGTGAAAHGLAALGGVPFTLGLLVPTSSAQHAMRTFPLDTAPAAAAGPAHGRAAPQPVPSAAPTTAPASLAPPPSAGHSHDPTSSSSLDDVALAAAADAAPLRSDGHHSTPDASVDATAPPAAARTPPAEPGVTLPGAIPAPFPLGPAPVSGAQRPPGPRPARRPAAAPAAAAPAPPASPTSRARRMLERATARAKSSIAVVAASAGPRQTATAGEGRPSVRFGRAGASGPAQATEPRRRRKRTPQAAADASAAALGPDVERMRRRLLRRREEAATARGAEGGGQSPAGPTEGPSGPPQAGMDDDDAPPSDGDGDGAAGAAGAAVTAAADPLLDGAGQRAFDPARDFWGELGPRERPSGARLGASGAVTSSSSSADDIPPPPPPPRQGSAQ